jgi:hypothetical protein
MRMTRETDGLPGVGWHHISVGHKVQSLSSQKKTRCVSQKIGPCLHVLNPLGARKPQDVSKPLDALKPLDVQNLKPLWRMPKLV